MSLISYRSLLLFVLLLIATASRAASPNLPDLGDESGSVISPAEERKLGEQVMRQIRGSPQFVTDAEITRYVQDLGDRLVGNSDAVGMSFEFFAIDDPTINAFAIPGGFVGVHTGLILAAQSESEVAAVLAHEISHISQRHIQRMIAEGKRTTRKVMLGMLAALALAVAGEGAGAGAAAAVAQAGGVQQQLNFSRSAEEEADRVGIDVLAKSGMDPQAMPTFFERMQAWGRVNETNLPEFLRTHPVTTSRIADSRDRAQHYPYRQVPDSVEFYRVRAKLRAEAKSNPNEIVNAFRQNLAQGKYRNLEAEHYGYALALMRVSDFAGARNEAALLVREHPDTPVYHLLRGDIEMKAGQFDQALNLYTEAEKRFPRSELVARSYAAALLKTGHPKRAMEMVKKALDKNPDDPFLQKMLATAAGDAGELFEAHRALATYYYHSGNPGAAIQQLQIAKRYTGGSYYLQAGLDARIKEIQQELGEDKKDKK
jgi:predicted Zn-dependent protease